MHFGLWTFEQPEYASPYDITGVALISRTCHKAALKYGIYLKFKTIHRYDKISSVNVDIDLNIRIVRQ